MTATTPSAPSRILWLIIASSMAMACVMYGVMIVILGPGSSPPRVGTTSTRIVFWVIAALMLAASVLGTRLRLRAPVRRAAESGEALPQPADFQVASLIMLALAESASVLGFAKGFLFGMSLRDYIPFGVASFAVMTLVVIPAGLAYWDAWESRQRGDPGPQPIR